MFSTLPATAQVVVDVFGWFSTSKAGVERGSRLEVISPGRLVDTRNVGGPLGSTEFREVQVRGATLNTGQVVPNDVVGVVLNIAAVNDQPGSTSTYVSVVPDPIPGQPSTSNLNVVGGVIKANSVIVPVGADGKIRLYNHAGVNHLAVDVLGWLQNQVTPDETTRGRVIPLSTPFRLWDTREPAWGGSRLSAGQAEDWSFAAFAGSVQINGASVGDQAAVIGNLTAAEVVRQYPTVPVSTYLTAWNPTLGRPESSVLNKAEGSLPVPNLTILPYSADKRVRFYNFQGATHYLFDASAVVLN
jgi:hypothetical protein